MVSRWILGILVSCQPAVCLICNSMHIAYLTNSLLNILMGIQQKIQDGEEIHGMKAIRSIQEELQVLAQDK